MVQPPSRRGLICAAVACAVFGAAPLRAQSKAEFEALKQQMQELMRQNVEQQKQIQQLQQQIEAVSPPQPAAAPAVAASPAAAPAVKAAEAALTPADPQEAIDKALAEIEPPTDVQNPAGLRAASQSPGLWSRRVGPATLRLIDVSMDLLTAVGSSTVGGQDLRDLQGGAHDPNRRGFTFQQGELSLAGAVDPYFLGEAHVVFTDSSVELEEAFFTTLALPYDLQLRGGYYFVNFGRINPVHPHAWTYLDQPVINTRMFGGEGLRSVGGELSWLAPLPWFSQLEVGIANADQGDLTVSFLNAEGGIGGRPAVTSDVHDLGDLLYLTRVANAWDLSPEWSTLLGFSGLYGANSTGVDASTFIYGADLTVKWRPADNFRGWPFLVWQTEVMKRDYTAAWFVAGTEGGDGGGGHGHDHGDAEEEEEAAFPNNLPGGILRDYGFYSYLLWGFAHPWAAGVRLEYATGNGDSVIDGELASRQLDPFRGDRWRVSPMLVYHPSEFSRIRLQYNYDNATFLPDDANANSVWLGVEVMYGAHPAHKY